MKYIVLLLTLLFVKVNLSASDSVSVILFTIDGLHWAAPQKLNMPVFNSLKEEGVYVQKSYMIIPHHPTVGEYSKYNSCSFPNPMLHEGTIFISPENKMIQEKISPEQQTAFVVNTNAYRSVARGFTTAIMDPSMSDAQVVDQAIELLKNQHIRFMRVHLQSPGVMGETVALHSKNKPYSNNIWAKGSPYVSAIENADKLLGSFISFLKKSGKWENCVLILTSDHGQSNVGWHPMLDEDSWTTPMLFAGKGMASGRKLAYFEHTDLAPTIAWLLGVDAPNEKGGAGKKIKEIKKEYPVSEDAFPQNIKTINRQIKTYNILHAQLMLKAVSNSHIANIVASLENENLTPEPFYHHDRITDWHKAKSTAHLIEANEKILDKMKRILK